MSDFLDPKKNFTVLGKVAVVAVAILIGVGVVYYFSGQDTKDTINQIGIGKTVIPWEDRADTAARKLLERNADNLAKSIQEITHPTGTEPSLESFQVSKLNNRVLVKIVIGWKGGFIGTDYQTSVAWEFSQEKHESAVVTFDSSTIGVMDDNKAALNNYFRTSVYPVLVEDMGP